MPWMSIGRSWGPMATCTRLTRNPTEEEEEEEEEDGMTAGLMYPQPWAGRNVMTG